MELAKKFGTIFVVSLGLCISACGPKNGSGSGSGISEDGRSGTFGSCVATDSRSSQNACLEWTFTSSSSTSSSDIDGAASIFRSLCSRLASSDTRTSFARGTGCARPQGAEYCVNTTSQSGVSIRTVVAIPSDVIATLRAQGTTGQRICDSSRSSLGISGSLTHTTTAP